MLDGWWGIDGWVMGMDGVVGMDGWPVQDEGMGSGGWRD